MEVLDTNVIVRYVTQDNLEQSGRARTLFLELESGTHEVYITEAVLVETVQVLSSGALYDLPRDQIGERLSLILNLRGVQMPFRRALHRALELYLTNRTLSFVDCLCVSHAERLGTNRVLSFDRGFDQSALRADTEVRRVEP